jgi:hypothetical protein
MTRSISATFLISFTSYMRATNTIFQSSMQELLKGTLLTMMLTTQESRMVSLSKIKMDR